MIRFSILIIFISCWMTASASTDESRIQIIHALEQWAKDFNAQNQQAVCGLFSPDLIASYPGIKDRNYDQMCETLTQSMHHPSKIFRYEAPKIEQMIIDDDLAVVRLIWTLKVLEKNQTTPVIIREKGLDVFKKQSNGHWKIVISYAYPLTGL